MMKKFYKDKNGNIIPDELVEDKYRFFGMDAFSRMEYEADKKRIESTLIKPLIDLTPKINIPPIEPIKPLIDFTLKINLSPIEPVKPLIDFTPKVNLDFIEKTKKPLTFHEKLMRGLPLTDD